MKKLLISLSFCLFAFIISAQNQSPNATTATGGQLAVTFELLNPGTEIYFSVYITNGAGQLVNTLGYRYGNGSSAQYSPQLSTFWSKIGNTFNIPNFKYVGNTDGTSGATTTSAIASKTYYWGKTAPNVTAVAAFPDGVYTINFESAKNNNNRKYASTTFTKGPAVSTAAAVSPAISTFAGISAIWTPAATGINNIELSTLYSIYPNPAITSVYVNGPDIQSVDVFTLEGKRIFSSNQQKLNIAALKKGTYMLSINTGKGNVSKKLIKN